MTLVLPIGACAYDAYINGIYYNFSGNEAEVTSSNNPGSYSRILVIPEFVGKDEKTYRVTSIGEEAFLDCRTLTSITIPNYLTHIGSGAFSGCKSLTEVHIKDMEAWCKITFGESHSNPLYYAKHLYMNGQEIKDLTIPNSIATINNYAFYNCSDLKTITLPGSITSIGHDAFSWCSSLTDVYCDANEVPEAVSSAFPYASLKSATLHVPAGSIDKYKAQSPWSRFGNIVALQEEPHQPQSFLEGNPIWVYKYERLTRGTAWKDGVHYGIFVDTGYRDYRYYFLGGQEEIDGKVYTMMGEVKSNGESDLVVSRWLPVREENGIVYAFTDSLPGLVEHDYLEPPYLQQGNECVLYNFNTEIGESLYPQNEYTKVESYGTYQLMNGAVCRVLKTTIEDFDLYEKLGYLHDGLYYGVMDPPSELISSTGGDVYATHLNAYYQNDIMLYKAPDIQESICVNDTCWTRDDAEAYAVTYKADPRQEEVFAYIRQLQKEKEPVSFTAGQMATIILPTEPDASKGKYYRLDRYEDGQIIFEQELQPQAHIPYIIVPNEDFSINLRTLDLTGLSRDTVSIAGISFIGSFTSEEFDYEEGAYIDIIDKTPDCRFDESCVIGALRAYLLVHWDDPYNQGGTRVPPLNKRGIVLRDYGTGITSPLVETEEATLYDLQGRKLQGKPSRGIYIENRKKVLVK
ncbi:MAG: leucine-rich repeat domain-containing protein [Bacteroidaceae bacterium]|nr:leucine-rich repeat domain-containing protein [Bacteroidaceae bacterium]